ncbi:hypothetical protein TRFO_22280 [Tritrichomonas foetus]|uniref:Uncharacterized protein n=1 Tax=Tritrichomonas foetus TaxID=1144522 RepID=A0A1J4KC11_9EUKA|nr:hypothetical protein TRFO_22280 [Tritrichomonas foetus]|eukprot:OHT08953.1 hypothetical protein TRFO_22280 [Tritrichomonas foetus]
MKIAAERRQYKDKIIEKLKKQTEEQIEQEYQARKLKIIYNIAKLYAKPAERTKYISEEENQLIKDKRSIDLSISKIDAAKNRLLERKKYIPMLEFEYALLTACQIPQQLYLPTFHKYFKNKEINSRQFDSLNIEIKFDDFKQFFSSDIKFYTKLPKNNDMTEYFRNLSNNDLESRYKKLNLTHAHVTVVFLSLLEGGVDSWIPFLEYFCEFYEKNPSERFSLLYFITVWFELRPKHFLRMVPCFIDFVDKVNDQGYFAKHLCMILEYSKRIMKFKALQLDSIPAEARLRYVQFGDYHKQILGTTAENIQNSFGSNMIKKHDPFSVKAFMDSLSKASKSKDKKKETNDSGNEPSTEQENPDNDDSRPNDEDFYQAFIICLSAIRQTLSLDSFINFANNTDIIINSSSNVTSNTNSSTNTANENSDQMHSNESNNRSDEKHFTHDSKNNFINQEQMKKFDDQMDSIDLLKTKNLKNYFTQEEFGYWQNNIKKINCNNYEIVKLSRLFDGIPLHLHRQVESCIKNTQKDFTIDIKQQGLKHLLNIIQKFREPSKSDQSPKQTKYLNYHELLKFAIRIFPETYALMKSDDNFSRFAKDFEQLQFVQRPLISPTCFFTEQQNKYFSQFHLLNCLKVEADEQKYTYKNVKTITEHILNLMLMKPDLKDIDTKGIDLSMSNAGKQFVDPWAIRIVFYLMTEAVFQEDDKNEIK